MIGCVLLVLDPRQLGFAVRLTQGEWIEPTWRGAGDVRVPLLITWIGFFAVRIPLAYLLTGKSVDMGLYGAWLAMLADLQIRGLFILARFAGGGWRGMRV